MSYPLPQNKQPLFHFHEPAPQEQVPMEVDPRPALPEPEEKHEINPEAEALHTAIEENRKLQKKIVKIHDKTIKCKLDSILTSLKNSAKNILKLECFENERRFRLFTETVLRKVVYDRNYSAYPALMTAVEKGYLKTTLKILGEAAKEITGETIDLAITICTENIQKNNPKNKQIILKQLLEIKKLKETKDIYPVVHLCNTAKNGDAKSLKTLLDYGYPADGQDDEKETALHKVMQWRKYKDQLEIIHILFENNCNPNIKNNKNLPPICSAIQHDRRHALKELLKLEVKEETIKESTGIPLFLYAIKQGSKEIIKHYLANKTRAKKYANKEIRDESGRNALHYLASKNSHYHQYEIVDYSKKLLAIGYDINDTDANGNTVLDLQMNNVDKTEMYYQCYYDGYFKFLNDCGVNFSKKNTYGLTALHTAIARQALKTYKTLLKFGANQNVTDDNGNTLLHYLVKQMTSPTVKIEEAKNWICNTDLYLHRNALNKNGETPIHLLIKNDRLDLIKLLLMETIKNQYDGRELELIHLAALDDQFALLEKIVSHENINQPDSVGFTALHYGAINDKQWVISSLIMKGANTEVKCHHGNTPLMHACHLGNINSVKCLLDHGANINALTADNQNIFSFIFQKNKYEIYKLLLENGLSISHHTGPRFSFVEKLNYKEDLKAFLNALDNVSRYQQTKNFLSSYYDYRLAIKTDKEEESLCRWINQITNLEELLTGERNGGGRDLEIVLTLACTSSEAFRLFQVTHITPNLKLKKQIIEAHQKYDLLPYLYTIDPSHFSKLPDDTTLPDEVPEVKLSDLHDVNKRLNTLQCKIYQDNREGVGNLRELEAQRKGHDLLIKRVSEAKPMVGTPRENEPEKLQQFWKNVDVMLKLLIQKIDNLTKAFEENIENCHALSEEDTLKLIKMNECMRDLKLAAPYCATRINQAVSKYYTLIYLSQEYIKLKKHERQCYQLLKNIRNSIVKKTVASFRPENQVHVENYIFKAFGKQLGLSMPNDYKDPTVSDQAAKTIEKQFRNNLYIFYNSHTLVTEFLKSNKEYNVKFNDFTLNLIGIHPGADLHPFIENYEDILMGQDVEAKLTVHGAFEILRSLEVLKMVF